MPFLSFLIVLLASTPSSWAESSYTNGTCAKQLEPAAYASCAKIKISAEKLMRQLKNACSSFKSLDGAVNSVETQVAEQKRVISEGSVNHEELPRKMALLKAQMIQVNSHYRSTIESADATIREELKMEKQRVALTRKLDQIEAAAKAKLKDPNASQAEFDQSMRNVKEVQKNVELVKACTIETFKTADFAGHLKLMADATKGIAANRIGGMK